MGTINFRKVCLIFSTLSFADLNARNFRHQKKDSQQVLSDHSLRSKLQSLFKSATDNKWTVVSALVVAVVLLFYNCKCNELKEIEARSDLALAELRDIARAEQATRRLLVSMTLMSQENIESESLQIQEELYRKEAICVVRIMTTLFGEPSQGLDLLPPEEESPQVSIINLIRQLARGVTNPVQESAHILRRISDERRRTAESLAASPCTLGSLYSSLQIACAYRAICRLIYIASGSYAEPEFPTIGSFEDLPTLNFMTVVDFLITKSAPKRFLMPAAADPLTPEQRQLINHCKPGGFLRRKLLTRPGFSVPLRV